MNNDKIMILKVKAITDMAPAGVICMHTHCSPANIVSAYRCIYFKFSGLVGAFRLKHNKKRGKFESFDKAVVYAGFWLVWGGLMSDSRMWQP